MLLYFESLLISKEKYSIFQICFSKNCYQDFCSDAFFSITSVAFAAQVLYWFSPENIDGMFGYDISLHWFWR